jgi:hypothetical protein
LDVEVHYKFRADGVGPEPELRGEAEHERPEPAEEDEAVLEVHEVAAELPHQVIPCRFPFHLFIILLMSNLANYSPYNKSYKFILLQNQAYH